MHWTAARCDGEAQQPFNMSEISNKDTEDAKIG